MKEDILYKRDLTGGIIQWRAQVERVIMPNGINRYRITHYYGKVNGNTSTSYSDIILAKSKKTDLEQAKFELQSLYARQKKKGYKSLEDLNITNDIILNSDCVLYKTLDERLPKYNTDANNCIKPMKCQKFSIGKFNYPCIIQPKINGVRAVVMLEEFIPTDLFSTVGFQRDDKWYRSVIKTKEGLVYDVSHINQLFDNFYKLLPQYANVAFDGEIYIRGEKVTSIGGAARNRHNPLYRKLQFVNFDLSIPDYSNRDRDGLRFKIWQEYMNVLPNEAKIIRTNEIFESLSIDSHKLWDGFTVIVLNSDRCWDDDSALIYMQKAINQGFEGAVIRDYNSEYKFGSRPKTMMKLKKFDDAEFKCIDITAHGNPDNGVGFSVVLILKNDINDEYFQCTVPGTIQERLDVLNNPPIGKMITVKFYERTINGLPFHAVAIGARDYEK